MRCGVCPTLDTSGPRLAFSIVKDPTKRVLVHFGAGASPLRVSLRTGFRHGTEASACGAVAS